MLIQIDFLDEILAVEKFSDRLFAAALVDFAASVGEGKIADLAGHLFRRAERGQIERADHRIRPVEIDVVGVVLLALDQPVGIAVLRES